MSPTTKPWWQTMDGSPAFLKGKDLLPWHAWLYAAVTLGVSAVLLVVLPPLLVAPAMGAFAGMAAVQAYRGRKVTEAS